MLGFCPAYDGPAMLSEDDLPPPPQPDAAAGQPRATSRQLRRFITRHNRQALLLAFFSLAGSVLLWGMLYLGLYWFTLVAVTVGRSMNPKTIAEITQRDLVGADFLPHFLIGAVLVLVAGAVIRKKVSMESLREQRHYFLWVLIELFMAVPNITFSVWGNLSAMCRLRRGEIEQAWGLLRSMEAAGGRMSMASLPLEIQDERTLGRVVFALQVVGLVGVREKTEGWFLYLQKRNELSLRTA